MEKISCEVVKDLLPLYVDEVLSDGSCRLVESHIATCCDCKECYKELKDTNISLVKKKANEGKGAIQKIRKKIKTKRVGIICLTAILVIAISVGLFYGLVCNQSYLPYEKTGLYVENGELCTNEPYYCYYGFDSPEEGTVFVYMTTTFYDSHRGNQKNVTVDVFLDNDSSATDIVDDPETKQVYYVPREYVEFLRDDCWVSAETEEDYITKNLDRIEELKENSILVWKYE